MVPRSRKAQALTAMEEASLFVVGEALPAREKPIARP